jgi:hypothetical protein
VSSVFAEISVFNEMNKMNEQCAKSVLAKMAAENMLLIDAFEDKTAKKNEEAVRRTLFEKRGSLADHEKAGWWSRFQNGWNLDVERGLVKDLEAKMRDIEKARDAYEKAMTTGNTKAKLNELRDTYFRVATDAKRALGH